MLFITNRQPKGSTRTKVNRKFKFDLDNNCPSNDIYFCQRNGEDDFVELGSREFLTKIRVSQATQILLYIHDSNNLPEPDIFPQVEMLQQLYDEKSRGLVQVIPVIWPCDADHGIVKDYWNDWLSAEASAYSFARGLQKYLDWRKFYSLDPMKTCLKRINIMCHGLGCRVFEQTIDVWTRSYGNGHFPLLFRNLFLIAGDIRNDIFKLGKTGQQLVTSSRNIVVYYAADDLVLSGLPTNRNPSKGIPLGLTGPIMYADMPSNIISVECDNFNSSYDRPYGHTYFLQNYDEKKPGSVFEHMFNSVSTGRVEANEKGKHILS